MKYLRNTHLFFFFNQKTKVNIAAQILNQSVTGALPFYMNTLHLPQFNDCQGTADFLYIADHLFDILNSRNKSARGMRGSLKPEAKLQQCYSFVKLIHILHL